MAASIKAKSAIRKEGSQSIIYGYAELPAVHMNGNVCWALPGKDLIFCPEEAKEAAKKLNSVIKASMQRTGRTLI